MRGVNLAIEEREFAAVAGPSGSGKTTLLNIIATVDSPTSGRVLVKGRDIAKLSDDDRTTLRSRMVGYVFQRFNLVPVLTAVENVVLPLELCGIKSREAVDRAARQPAAASRTRTPASGPSRCSSSRRS